MNNKIKLRIFTSLTILSFPAVAVAKAGLAELDDAATLFFVVSLLFAICFVPIGIKASWTVVWYFAWLQIPLILVIVALAARTLYVRKCRTLTYFLILPTLYAVLTLTTNVAAIKFFASDPFPKGKAIERFFNGWHEEQKPTEADIIQYLGKPYAEGLFPATSPALPSGMGESMKRKNVESAFILAYIEKDRGPSGLETQTYYIFLDPATRRYVGNSGYFDQATAADKWPHKTFLNITSNTPLEPSR